MKAESKKNALWRNVSGFAFSAAPGNDKLVTDKLIDRIG
jgi:hypothetical protein